ncbi:MAG: hypothetical protein RBS88_12960 [Spongiibacteraceae bacterium]|jgi:hypothetical protein|nr:hypothetical protein [Spongiibacteraceae bacterium]
MTKNKPDSTPADAVPDATSESTGPGKTADTIRAALRNKANGAGARGRGNPFGTGQKPPPAPYGTRRSMGKR